MTTHARACALQLLRDLNVPTPNGGRSGRPRAFTLAQEVAILARLTLGERQIAIAAELVVNRATIGRLWRRAKLIPRGTKTEVIHQTPEVTPCQQSRT